MEAAVTKLFSRVDLSKVLNEFVVPGKLLVAYVAIESIELSLRYSQLRLPVVLRFVDSFGVLCWRLKVFIRLVKGALWFTRELFDDVELLARAGFLMRLLRWLSFWWWQWLCWRDFRLLTKNNLQDDLILERRCKELVELIELS